MDANADLGLFIGLVHCEHFVLYTELLGLCGLGCNNFFDICCGGWLTGGGCISIISSSYSDWLVCGRSIGDSILNRNQYNLN